MYINIEYLLIGTGIVLCFVVAFILDSKRNKNSNKTEWKDLNKLLADLYKDNEILKSNIFESANKQRLLDAVLDQVKLNAEGMFQANQTLIDQYQTLTRKCDGFEQEIAHLKNEIPNPPELTADDLDDWNDEQHPVEQMDLFQTDEDEFS